MKPSGPGGFAVVYQWRVRAGLDRQFREAWEALTRVLIEQRGACGSRLHRADAGTYVAYALWPSRAVWEQSCTLHEQDQTLSQQILDAVEDTWSPMLLETVADLSPESGRLQDPAALGAPPNATH
ncbi:MAG: antibiotic biosynthesis monooxygenase [Nevskiales bacterium]|nr:antibiotic biosynthesis monooxygenase [Nevskiales bacterium]